MSHIMADVKMQEVLSWDEQHMYAAGNKLETYQVHNHLLVQIH